MKLKCFVVFALAGISAVSLSAAAPDTVIWLDQPAAKFTESSPVGNGRLGAMDFGGVETQRIVLNEGSL